MCFALFEAIFYFVYKDKICCTLWKGISCRRWCNPCFTTKIWYQNLWSSALPWECRFPMIQNDNLRCFITGVLLHSQRHFDSFACDSCQFLWSTPLLLKTLGKPKNKTKNKKNKNNNISRLFEFPAKTLWKEVKTSEKTKKQKNKKAKTTYWARVLVT